MFFLRFLHDKIPPDDNVMHSFVEQMLPSLFDRYADQSAKGGDQQARSRGLGDGEFLRGDPAGVAGD